MSFSLFEKVKDDTKLVLVVGAFTLCVGYILAVFMNSANLPRRTNNRSRATGTAAPPGRGETFQDAYAALTNTNGVERIYTRDATDSNNGRARQNWEALIDADQERRRRLARRNIEGLRREIQNEVRKRAVKRTLRGNDSDQGPVSDSVGATPSP